ncbi:hypothetical protein HK102_012880, partial [Quaeritorhiza haematococci]
MEKEGAMMRERERERGSMRGQEHRGWGSEGIKVKSSGDDDEEMVVVMEGAAGDAAVEMMPSSSLSTSTHYDGRVSVDVGWPAGPASASGPGSRDCGMHHHGDGDACQCLDELVRPVDVGIGGSMLASTATAAMVTTHLVPGMEQCHLNAGVMQTPMDAVVGMRGQAQGGVYQQHQHQQQQMHGVAQYHHHYQQDSSSSHFVTGASATTTTIRTTMIPNVGTTTAIEPSRKPVVEVIDLTGDDDEP